MGSDPASKTPCYHAFLAMYIVPINANAPPIQFRTPRFQYSRATDNLSPPVLFMMVSLWLEFTSRLFKLNLLFYRFGVFRHNVLLLLLAVRIQHEAHRSIAASFSDTSWPRRAVCWRGGTGSR